MRIVFYPIPDLIEHEGRLLTRTKFLFGAGQISERATTSKAFAMAQTRAIRITDDQVVSIERAQRITTEITARHSTPKIPVSAYTLSDRLNTHTKKGTGYYCPRNKVIRFRSATPSVRTVIHEAAHAVMDHHFGEEHPKPPVHGPLFIHLMLAELSRYDTDPSKVLSKTFADFYGEFGLMAHNIPKDWEIRLPENSFAQHLLHLPLPRVS